LAERFSAIVWDEANRARHEAKRPAPRFEAARKADWSRIFKRRDIEHRGSPERHQALVGRDLGVGYAVYFVVFTKANGYLNVITIRYASHAERQIFLR
jgi:uncharacterized DUF497 family protein